MADGTTLLEMVLGLYQYNRWATDRVLETAAQVTPEQWLTPGQTGHGSVRDTLVHIISTQRSWLSWWDGSRTAAEGMRLTLTPVDFPDPAAVQDVEATVEGSTQAFLDRVTEADLLRVYTNPMPNGQVFRLPLWKMMVHVVNHGTQHRSEAAALLTSFGHSPGGLDLLWFYQPFGEAGAP